MDIQIDRLIAKFGINLNNVSLDTIKKGISVEMEHGYKAGLYMNLINDDILQAFKIAMAHIDEFPDYYERLEKLEKEAEIFWKNKIIKPNYNYDREIKTLNKIWYSTDNSKAMIFKDDIAIYIKDNISYTGYIDVENNKNLVINVKDQKFEIIKLTDYIMFLKNNDNITKYVSK